MVHFRVVICSENVAQAVRELKEQPGKNILVDGSSVLIQELARHDLVDEYNLHVYPIVLGTGKRLFPAGTRLDLTLVEAVPLPTGVVFMRYRRAGSARPEAQEGARQPQEVPGGSS